VSLVATVEWGSSPTTGQLQDRGGSDRRRKGRARKDRLWLRCPAVRSIWRWRCSPPAPDIVDHVPYKGATQAATDVAAARSRSAFRASGPSQRWCGGQLNSLV